MLYQIQNGKLSSVPKKDISEEDLEDLLEKNLSELFPDLVFVSRQFPVEGRFLDILAFDREQNSPVIFELKKGRASEIVAQGLQYFRFLSTRKNDFRIEFLKKKVIKNHDDKINWEASKLIFVAENFPEREIDSASFNFPIELFKFAWFKNGNFVFEKVERRKEKAKIENILKDPEIVKIQKGFKEYDREFHHQKTPPKIWELFEKIENEILSWDDNLKEKFTKVYVGFWRNKKMISDIEILQNSLKITFGKYPTQKFELKNLKIRNMVFPKEIGRLGNGDFQIKIENDENLDDLFYILKQNYKFLKK